MDTFNQFLVGARGDRIVIANPPRAPMDRDTALVFAAWIVALADPGGERFAEALAAVQST